MRPIAVVRQQTVEELAGAAEREGRLEQWHDVEGRRLPAGRVMGERQDVGDIGWALGERHDIAGQRPLAEPRLDPGDSPNDLVDLLVGHAPRVGRVPSEAPTVDRRMLAHLERGQVEAKRLDLPAEVLNVAPGHPRQTDLDEGLLDLPQLRDELGRAAIGTRGRRALLREAAAGSAEALGDERKPLPEWLVRVPLAHRPIEVGKCAGVAGQLLAEVLRDAAAANLCRQRLGNARRDGFVAAEDVVRLDPDRRLGDLGGDVPVAVAVAADPGPEMQERWRERRLEIRVALPRRPRRRGALDLPVDARREPVDRLVEEDHRRPHLVEWAGHAAPDLGRLPQDRDLLPQAASKLAVGGRRQPWVVRLLQEPGDAPQGEEDGSAPRLRRVGGQDERDRQALEHGLGPPFARRVPKRST